MNAQRVSLMNAGDWLAEAPGDNLPRHDFHIGEDDEASIKQLPNLRTMAFHVVGRAPITTSAIASDPVGTGSYALGAFVGDAALKLLRPWPVASTDVVEIDTAQFIIGEIGDGLLPLSPAAEEVRVAFLFRLGEFLEIALNQPQRLPEIVAKIDALTNARLTERARAILTRGEDPGAGDLWPGLDADMPDRARGGC